MQDRVPLYPGRVKLVPVAGQENVYDMVRADQPTQDGTPLNKASLLTDATAALFGLGTDAVPDDALSAINTLIQAAQTTADGKATIVTGTYTGNGAGSRVISLGFTPKAVLLAGKGTLIDPSFYNFYGGLALTESNAVAHDGQSVLEIQTDGFKVRQTGSAYANESGTYYNYIAFY